MSKGEDASKLGHGTAGRELTEVDLGAVSGGFFAVEHGEIGCPNSRQRRRPRLMRWGECSAAAGNGELDGVGGSALLGWRRCP
jgi:hypothetical protein